MYRRIAVHRRIDYQRIGVSDSNVQHNKLVHRRIGVHRRIDYHTSAYQIPTFNQQIGAPANQRTQANRLPLIGVSDSNVQHNKLVHRRIGVHRRIDYHTSAYQIPTFNTTNWYTGEAAYRRPANGDRRVAVSDSNVQHNRLVHRQIGVHGRIDYHPSAYQIPTSNTTDWYTGESAYTGESITIIRRIRFQRPTQQIGIPANRRTQANRLPSVGVSDSNVQHNRLVHRRSSVHGRIDYHRVGVSDSNVQHNRLVHRRSGVPATGESIRIRFQRSTQQIGTPANRRTGDRRVAVSDSNVQHNRLVHRRIGVPATGESPYQIPTFNTTDWHTGEAAYRRPASASRRIRFQRSTQQIGTPARRRTGDRRSATGDRRPATGDRRPASRRINFQRKRR